MVDRRGDGGPGPAALFELAGIQLDVGTVGIEQAQLTALAPGEELAQVEGVGLPGATRVAGQEAGEGDHLRIGGAWVEEDQGRRVRHGALLSLREPGPTQGGSRPSSGCQCRGYAGVQEGPYRRPLRTGDRAGLLSVPYDATRSRATRTR